MAGLKLRFAVGHARFAHSTVWSVISAQNEVYALHRTMGHVEKISLHSSRICRRAYIASHARPSLMDDRVLNRWERLKTPPVSKKKIVVGLEVGFPSNQLSNQLEATAKKVSWIPAAPAGFTTIVQIIYTKDTEAGLATLLAPLSTQLVAYHRLPNGEAVAVVSFEQVDTFTGIIMPASMGERRDLVVPMQGNPAIKRPIGLTLFDGARGRSSYLSCLELTGFFVPAGMGSIICPGTGAFSRDAPPHRNVPPCVLKIT